MREPSALVQKRICWSMWGGPPSRGSIAPKREDVKGRRTASAALHSCMEPQGGKRDLAAAAAIVRLGWAGVNGLAHLEGGSGEAGASSERRGYSVCTQFEPLLLRRRSYLLEQRR